MTAKNSIARDGVIFISELEISFYSEAYLEDEIPNPVSQLLYHLEEEHLQLQHTDLNGGLLHHKGVKYPTGYDFSYPAQIHVAKNQLEWFLKTIIDVTNTRLVDHVDRHEYLTDDINDEEGNMICTLIFFSIECDEEGMVIQEYLNPTDMDSVQRIYVHTNNLSRLKKFYLELQSSI